MTDRLIAQHGGRIANTAGDSILAEFPSAVDALQCALGIQERIAAVHEEVPEERRVSFRIGLYERIDFIHEQMCAFEAAKLKALRNRSKFARHAFALATDSQDHMVNWLNRNGGSHASRHWINPASVSRFCWNLAMLSKVVLASCLPVMARSN